MEKLCYAAATSNLSVLNNSAINSESVCDSSHESQRRNGYANGMVLLLVSQSRDSSYAAVTKSISSLKDRITYVAMSQLGSSASK